MRYLLALLFFFIMQYTIAQSSDMRLLEKINSNRNVQLDGTLYRFSQANIYINLGSTASLLIVGLAKKDNTTKQKGLLLATSHLLAAVVTFSGKKIIQRERPFLINPAIEPYYNDKGFAMPSGHTATAFANATALSIAYPKWYVIVPSFTYASIVGYSRLHLGVHYPSDVLVGAIVGSGSALLSNYVVKKLYLKNIPTKKKVL